MEAIKLYLKEIKNTPLLTPEEEIQLARKIKKASVVKVIDPRPEPAESQCD